MQQQKEKSQKLEHQMDSLHSVVNLLAELSDKNQKIIDDFLDNNRRTLTQIERNINILTMLSAYEYQYQNFDRDF